MDQWKALAEVPQNEDVAEYTTSTTEQLAELLDGDGEERVVLFSHTFSHHYDDAVKEGKNYVLIVKGQKWGNYADRPILLGTHYDSVPNSPG